MRPIPTVAILLIVALAAPLVAKESEWGDLKLRFVYDGETAPADEGWMVDEKTKGVANVLMWLEPPERGSVATHPDLVEPKQPSVTVKIAMRRFEPHVTIVRRDQSLVLSNRDPFGHNPKPTLFTTRPSTNSLPPAPKRRFHSARRKLRAY